MRTLNDGDKVMFKRIGAARWQEGTIVSVRRDGDFVIVMSSGKFYAVPREKVRPKV